MRQHVLSRISLHKSEFSGRKTFGTFLGSSRARNGTLTNVLFLARVSDALESPRFYNTKEDRDGRSHGPLSSRKRARCAHERVNEP